MKTVADIANLITIRNFLWAALNGPRHLIAKSDLAAVNALALKLDRDILASSMEALKEQPSAAGVVASDEEDIAKKIAEAKAKMAAAGRAMGIGVEHQQSSEPAQDRPKFKKDNGTKRQAKKEATGDTKE